MQNGAQELKIFRNKQMVSVLLGYRSKIVDISSRIAGSVGGRCKIYVEGTLRDGFFLHVGNDGGVYAMPSLYLRWMQAGEMSSPRARSNLFENMELLQGGGAGDNAAYRSFQSLDDDDDDFDVDRSALALNYGRGNGSGGRD